MGVGSLYLGKQTYFNHCLCLLHNQGTSPFLNSLNLQNIHPTKLSNLAMQIKTDCVGFPVSRLRSSIFLLGDYKKPSGIFCIYFPINKVGIITIATARVTRSSKLTMDANVLFENSGIKALYVNQLKYFIVTSTNIKITSVLQSCNSALRKLCHRNNGQV